MSSKEEDILRVLSEDLLRLEDIHACMVARKNLEGIVPITEEFKAEITEVWEILKEVMNEFFGIISRYSKYELNKAYFELGAYGVLFYVLKDSDTALVAIFPRAANRDLIEERLDKARKKIVGIIDQE